MWNTTKSAAASAVESGRARPVFLGAIDKTVPAELEAHRSR
ncbi:hypothetical protein [Actinomadura oligospora]|nr:hypothetical protein [Actinomadura oligospora]